MSFGLRIRLSMMMFLQYFVWGIWLPMLGQQLGKNGLNLDARRDRLDLHRLRLRRDPRPVHPRPARRPLFRDREGHGRRPLRRRPAADRHGLRHRRSGRSSSCCSSTATSTCPRWACPTRSRSAAWARRTRASSPASGSGGRSAGSRRASRSPPTSTTTTLGFYQIVLRPARPARGVRVGFLGLVDGERRPDARSRCSRSPGSASRRSATACGSPGVVSIALRPLLPDPAPHAAGPGEGDRPDRQEVGRPREPGADAVPLVRRAGRRRRA